MTNSSLAHKSDIFNEIKQNVSILAVIKRYSSVELKKSGRDYKCLCPFHREKTPSFTVSPSKQMFYCFGCGTGGDAVTFVAKLFNLQPLEAARLICRDFGLPVCNQLLSREARLKIREQQKKRELEKAFRQWCERKYLDVCALYRQIHFQKAYEWIDYIFAIERDLNVLQFGSDSAKLQLFCKRRERPWLL